jgi:branched-chain amino acid transport system ATP-binding protein
MSASAEQLLRIEGLTKRFGGLAAVDGVSLAIRRGSISALIGPNGAGKTTLFSLISGFVDPTEGRVTFAGRDVTGLRPERIAERGLVRTFQLVRLFPQMTVLENVLVGCHLHSKGEFLAALLRPGWLKRQEARLLAEARELLELVGLTGEAASCAANLTYGRQRLLEVARALAARPTLLLLDEPAAGFSPAETVALAALIRTLRDRGVTVLFVEHDMDLVMNIADEVHVLDFGRCIASGRPERVREDPAVLAAYLGNLAPRPSDAVARV